MDKVKLERYLQKADAFFQSGDYHWALAFYEDALRIDPTCRRAIHGVITTRIGMSQGQHPKTAAVSLEPAFKYIERLLRSNPNNAEMYLIRASAWMAAGEPTRADQDYSRVISLLGLESILKDKSFMFQDMVSWNSNTRRISDRDGFPESKYHRLKKYFEIIIHNTAALKHSAGSAQIYLERAMAYRAVQEHDLAIEDYKAACKMSQLDAKQYIQKGCQLHDKGDYLNAIAHFSAAIDADPSSVDAFANRSRAYQAIGNTAWESNDYIQACKLKQDSPAENIRIGSDLLAKGEYHKAILHFTNALDRDPNLIDAYLKRSTAYLHIGMHDLARIDYLKSCIMQPMSPEEHIQMGCNLLNKGESERDHAISHFTAAIEKRPGWAEPFLRRADVYRDMGFREYAEADYTKWSMLQPMSPEEHLQMGSILLQKSDHVRAILHFNTAIEKGCEVAKAYLLRADAYEKIHVLDNAESDYKHGCQLEHLSPEGHVHVGKQLLDKGDYRKVIIRCDIALSTNGKLAEAYAVRAKAYRALKDNTHADADVKMACYAQPISPEEHVQTAQTLCNEGKYAEAILHCSTAIEIKPDLAEAYLFRAHAVYAAETNRITGWRELPPFKSDLMKAFELGGHDANYYLKQGLDYYQRNELVMAEIYLSESLRRDDRCAAGWYLRGDIYLIWFRQTTRKYIINHASELPDADFTDFVQWGPDKPLSGASPSTPKDIIHELTILFRAHSAERCKANTFDPLIIKFLALPSKLPMQLYNKAMKDYSQGIACDPAEANAYKKKHPHDLKSQIITEIFSGKCTHRINRSTHPHTSAPVEKLTFELLPPGQWSIDDVIAHYKREAKNFGSELAGRRIEIERLRSIEKLKPNHCYIGKEGWLGYIVFTFSQTDVVVLECPIEGNATYILADDKWKKAARDTKQYLRDNYRYRRYSHRSEKWLENVSNALLEGQRILHEPGWSFDD